MNGVSAHYCFFNTNLHQFNVACGTIGTSIDCRCIFARFRRLFEKACVMPWKLYILDMEYKNCWGEELSEMLTATYLSELYETGQTRRSIECGNCSPIIYGSDITCHKISMTNNFIGFHRTINIFTRFSKLKCVRKIPHELEEEVSETKMNSKILLKSVVSELMYVVLERCSSPKWYISQQSTCHT